MWDVKLRRLAANRSAAHGTAFFLTGALLFCGGSGLVAVTAAVASVAVAPAGTERESFQSVGHNVILLGQSFHDNSPFGIDRGGLL